MRKTIKDRLEEEMREAKGAGKAIASFMLANLNTLPFESSATLSEKLGVSQSTIGRFCRTLGYQHLKDLKVDIQHDLGDSPWLVGDLLAKFRQHSSALQHSSLDLEIAALVRVYELSRTPEWATVVNRLATIRRVYIAGFQAERGMAITLAHLLQYIRDRVHIVDNAGSFGDILITDVDDVALVVFDVKRYSRHSLLLCKYAKERGIPVTLITDNYCEWAAEYATEVLRVSTDFNFFWESTSAMSSLSQILVNDVFKALGPGVENRLEQVAAMYHDFVGYTSKGS